MGNNLKIQQIHTVVTDFHNFLVDLNDDDIDRLLNLNFRYRESNLRLSDMREQTSYEGTPYSYIRELMHWLNPNAGDMVYDLGSGYGRFVIYGALVTEALFKGIEIVPERVQVSEQIAELLGLYNASFESNNARSANFSDGNIFFLFNPFNSETLQIINTKLKSIASNKLIKIASWGGQSNRLFASEDWLEEIKPGDCKEIQLFISTTDV